MPHIAIYARQSIDRKESISIDSQIDFCAREANGEEYQIYQDRGFSGKNTKRPGFQSMISQIEQGLVSKVICYRLDRISRSTSDFGTIWDICATHNVEFISVNEKFDTSTPMGRAMLHIIMVFAQLERETIAERVRDNYYERTKKGAWPGGKPPYGFTLEKIKGQGATLLLTDALKNAATAFSLYSANGASLGSVSRHLNQQGILPGSGHPWSTVSLCRMLRSPLYTMADARIYAYYTKKGVTAVNDIDEFTGVQAAMIIGKRLSNERKYMDVSDHILALANHKGIIPSDLFLAVQQKLDTNKQVKNSGKGKLSWLSGLIKCGQCGYSLILFKDVKNKDRIYVKCSGRTTYNICDHRHSERIDEVEEQVKNQVIAFFHRFSFDSLGEMPLNNEVLNAIAKIDVKINNLVNALADSSGPTLKYVSEAIEKLEKERQSILEKTQHTKISLSVPKPSLSHSSFNAMTFEEKKLMANQMIDRILLTSNSVAVQWKV